MLGIWQRPGGGGGASVGVVDGNRGGDSGGGLGRDLHVNKSVGDVVDAVVRDGVRVRFERVHVASRGREGNVRSVVTLPSQLMRTEQHLPSLRTRSKARVETKYDAVAGWRRSLQRLLYNGVVPSRECS
jgi:hypothetical protein